MNRVFGVTIAGIVAVVTVVFPAIAESQVERQYGAHVHGEAAGTMALDGGRLELELELPGFNLVGFEHAPRTPEQQAALDSALAYLDGGTWLRTDTAGECGVAEPDVHSYGFSDEEHGDEPADSSPSDAGHHHDHGDAHDHDHEHGSGAGHSEFHISATLDCGSPDSLGWIEFDLFERFPGNEALRMDVLTDRLAARVRLHAELKRIELRADR